jgi:hypothetical protein
MFNYDFIFNVKICDAELHTMYCDLEKTFSPLHFYFFLDLVMHSFDSLSLTGAQSMYPTLIMLLSSLEAKKYASCD